MIKFTEPAIGKKELLYHKLEKIFESGVFTNNGRLVQELAQQLSKRWKGANVNLCCNATIGLLAALINIKQKNHDLNKSYKKVIILSGYGWPSSLQIPSILNYQIKVVDTYANIPTINWDLVNQNLDEQVAAVITTDMFGVDSTTGADRALLSKYGIVLINDAAHNFGIDSRFYPDEMKSDIAIISSHATKIFNTAEGGILVCKHLEDRQNIDHIINFGLPKHDIELALNAKMSELHAALGLAQLDTVSDIIKTRKCLSALYYSELKDGAAYHTVNLLGSLMNQDYWNGCYIPLTFANKNERNKVFDLLSKNQITARKYFDFVLSTNSDTKEHLINSSKFSETLCCMPIHPGLKPKEIVMITDLIKQVLDPKY